MANRGLILLAMASSLVSCGGTDAPVGDNALPALGANGRVSVAGISSGGYMAGQYQVAFSDQVFGSAIVSAGPWGCSGGSINTAIGACVNGEGMDVDSLIGEAEALASAGSIAPTAALADDRVFLFHAAGDVVVNETVVSAAAAWFGDFTSPQNVVQINDVAGVHGWLTEAYGVGCESFEPPYINSCGYDLAGEILGHWYGDLTPANESGGSVQAFDQQAFGDASLMDLGYVFVPDECREPGCDIVVLFHGCQQSAEVIGIELVENSGFNRWAASNSTVVLYPQVQASNIAPMNPLGCWDWWGYTDDDYLSRSAPQLAAVAAMITRLAATSE